MRFYKGILCYDGTPYFGWQKTRSGPSIQEHVEKALAQIVGEKREIEAASRTDRGVHAEGQIVYFSLEKEKDPNILIRGLNAVLPPSIRFLELDSLDLPLDIKGKIYHYRLCLSAVQDPIHRLYSWHFWYPLDIGKMEEASQSLLGTHDFTTFANEEEKNPYCTIEKIEIRELLSDRLQIEITGDRFLYKMVRNLVGTLLYIGCGKLPADCLPALLRSRDRKGAGVTAPAKGLSLHKVLFAKIRI